MAHPASDPTAPVAEAEPVRLGLGLGLHLGLPAAARQGVGLALALALLVQPPLASLAQAQQIVDPRAPIQFRPGLSVSANGTPVIAIATPSFGGVSHNKFQRYDVDTRGVVLNNSGQAGTSVIGGAVGANPNLARSRPAGVIVNEVTGTGSSTLNGPTEVFGGRADVVVANPNGVGCVGCRFINAGRVTLTTGVPTPDYDTGTVRYRVETGTVAVGGAGLAGGHGESLGRVDLIGRQIRLDGPVAAAGAVRLRAGAIDYDAAADAATPIPGAAPVTGPAVASGAAGTIRAGSISVLARDADLGVVLDGALTASSGGIAVRGYGDVSLAQSSSAADLRVEADGAVFVAGRHEAVGRITITGRTAEFALGASLTADDAIVVETLQDLVTRGTLVSGQDISLTAGGAVVASGTVSAVGRIALEGQSVTATGLGAAGRAIAVAGVDGVTLDGSGLRAGGDVSVSGTAISLGRGTAFDAGGRLAIDARDSLTTATILDNPNLDLSIRNRLTVTGTGGIVQDVLVLTLRGALVNDGLLYGRTSASLSAASLTNGADAAIYGGDVGVSLSGSLTNLGRILSARTLALAVDGLVRNDGTILAEGGLSLRARAYAAASPDAVLAGRTADLLVAGAFESAGVVLGGQGLTLQAASLRNDGVVAGGGSLTLLLVAGDIANAGTIFGGGSLGIAAGGAVVTPGHLYAAGGDLALRAGGAIVSGGDIAAAGTLTLRGASFSGDAASRLSGTAVDVGLDGAFASLGLTVASARIDVAAASITLGAGASLVAPLVRLTADGDLANAGTVAALTAFALTAGGRLTNDGTILAAAGTGGAGASGFLIAGGDLVDTGGIEATGALTVVAGGDLRTSATGLIVAGTLTAAAVGAVDNAGGLIAQGGDLTLAAGGIVSSSGDILAGGHLALTAAGYEGSATARTGGGDVVVRLGTGRLLNLGQIVAATGALDVEAGDLTDGAGARMAGAGVRLALSGAADNGGRIESTGDLTLTATGLTNAGAILADGTAGVTLSGAASNGGTLIGRSLALRVGGDLANAGLIGALGDLSVTAGGKLANTGSLIAQGGDLTLTAGGVVSTGGDIIAGGHLALTAAGYEGTASARTGGGNVVVRLGTGRLLNLGQIVAATGALDVEAGDLTDGTGARMAGAGVRLALSGAADNGGRIESTGDLALTATGLTNAGAILADGAGSLGVSGAVSNGGVLIGKSLALRVGGDLANAGLIGALGDLSVTAGGKLDNTGGLIAQGGDLTLATGGIVSSSGDILAGGHLALTAAGYEATAAARMGGGDVVVRLGTGRLLNLGQIVAATGALDVEAGDLSDGAGARMAGAGVRLALSGAADNGGRIESTGDLTLTATGLANAGAILANGAVGVSVSGAVSNGGSLLASRDATITAASYDGGAGSQLGARNIALTLGAGLSNAGEIAAAGLADLSAGTLDNAAGGRIAGRAIRLRVAGDIANAGTLAADDILLVEGGGGLRNGGLVSAGDIALTLATDLDNRDRILATGTLVLTGRALANAGGARIEATTLGLTLTGAATNAGAITAGDTLVLRAASLTNAGTAGQTATLSAPTLSLAVTGHLGNGPYASIAGGPLTLIRAATTDLDLVGVNDVAHGQFTAGGDLGLTLTGQGLTVEAGQTLAAAHGRLAVSVSGDVTVAGTISARDDLSLVSGGGITVGRVTTVTVPVLGHTFTITTVADGTIRAGGDGWIEAAGDLTSTASLIQAGGSLGIKAGGALTNTRLAQSETTSVVSPSTHATKSPDKYEDHVTTVSETSDPARIVAGRDLAIQAGTILNDASSITAGGVLGLQADTLDNHARRTGSYLRMYKVGGSVNIGSVIVEGWVDGPTQTPALLQGDGGVRIVASRLTNTGTITGSTVVIATTVLVNGLSDADIAPPVDSFAPATRANVAAAKADVLAHAPVGDAAAVSALSSAPLDAEATAGALFHAPVAIAGEDRSGTSTTRTASGLGVTVTADTGLASLLAGYHTKTTRLAVDTTAAAASAVTGGTGLVLAAGRDATLTAADLVSGGDLTVTAGRDLALLAGADVSHTLASRSRTAIGLTAQVGQNVTDALDQLEAAPRTAASGTGNDGYRAVGVALGVTGSRRSIRSGWDPSFMQLRQ